MELFSLQLKSYKDQDDPTHKKVPLRKEDVQLLIKDILNENFKNPPSIKELSKLVGMNEQKLQKGFKYLFNQTINKYLRKERMEYAKLLIIKGDMSIGEIAERVGYTNKSHFASRFKETYGLLPKDFSKSMEIKIQDV